MIKTTAEIRQMFLDFFHQKGHQVVSGSSLIPVNDPTLLFTNAGMNQFKDLFLGLEQRDYIRATTAQPCVRAGGKHNDLENVGYTARHHTFFEMLGNFSFGDYFKQNAIRYAWEFLTSDQWLNLPVDKLLVTVYATDDEAYAIWADEIGVSPEKIIKIGDNKGAQYASDNFWQMGETGPCGPCTEIFYDHGAHIAGGPPGSPDEDGDRFIEIWNLVFMQYNRQNDGTLLPLPKPSVDTGMGLERISAVMQHVNSNYEIDLFQALLTEVIAVTGTTETTSHSLKVIADHIRSCAFLIADGVMPSNEGRGYVLRRIIRRAVRHGNKLKAHSPFFYQLVAPLIKIMGDTAEPVAKKAMFIEEVLRREEEQFTRTLERGLVLLGDELNQVKQGVLSGEAAFKLYDTYGFPVDLTADICRERSIQVDEAGFDKQMEQQRQRARKASQFATDYSELQQIEQATYFDGYTENEANTVIMALTHKNGSLIQQLNSGESGVIFVETTTFYAESGGQVGDQGLFTTATGVFKVEDTQKLGQSIGHIGQVISGSINVQQEVHLAIDVTRRDAIRLNHSAAHLLHAALRQELGEHVAQKGSLVNERYVRFDFSALQPVTKEQLLNIERRVNANIRANLPIMTEIMALEQAKQQGAIALFGEKYSETVRVLSMGDESIELCGGTHAAHTGDLGLFRIISESSIATGIRRIEAVTGGAALHIMQEERELLNSVTILLKAERKDLVEKTVGLLEQAKKLEKQIEIDRNKQLLKHSTSLTKNVVIIGTCKLLVSVLNDIDVKNLRVLFGNLKNELGAESIIVLAAVSDANANLLIGVSSDLTETIKANELLLTLLQQVGGKGGGKEDRAEAGGCDAIKLQHALSNLTDWITPKLS